MIVTNCNIGPEELILNIVDELRHERFYSLKILILTSKSSILRELPMLLKKSNKTDAIQNSIIVGTKKEKSKNILKNADVYWANYDFLVSTQWEKIFLFDLIIVDEMSEFRNHKTKRYLNLAKYAMKGKWLVGISNNFLDGKLVDFWAQYFLLDGGESLEHNFEQFLEKYFFVEKKKETKGCYILPKNDSFLAIMNAVKDKTTYYEEEETKKKVIYIKLDSREYSKYIFYRTTSTMESKESNSVSVKLSHALLLLQVANGIVYKASAERIIHRQKIDCLKRLMERNNSKMVVLYWFQQDRNFILNEISEVVTLDDMCNMEIWNEGGVRVGIIQPAVFSRIIEIKADVLVWFSLPLSVEMYNTINNCFLEQNRQGKIIHIVTENSIDEKVFNIISKKGVKQEEIKRTLLEGVS